MIRPVRDAPSGRGPQARPWPGRETEGIAPMLAALAGYGAHVDEWAEDPVAFGCRRRPSEEGGDPPLGRALYRRGHGWVQR